MLRHAFIIGTCAIVLLLAGCSQNQTAEKQPASSSAENNTGDETVEVDEDDTKTLEPLQLTRPVRSQRDSQPIKVRPSSLAPFDQAVPVKLRIADNRPELNAARLQASGIRKFESRRLVLLTDLPDENVAELPELADQLFERLESHFGKLPPAADDSEFQVTGCLIGDVARFRTTGLMPGPEFGFKYGRHRDYQFWMYAPETDYYTRHLLLHEVTHCFMTCETTPLDIPPIWYTEGMAEFFATHRISDDGAAEFGILPEQFLGYEGWGRISVLDRIFKRSRKPTDSPEAFAVHPVEEVIRDVVWSEKESDYSRWWAICWLLQTNPDYKTAVDPLKFMRHRDEFLLAEGKLRQQLGHRLAVDWLLVAETLQPGFDTKRSFPIHSDQTIAATSLPHSLQIAADRDWQDTGVRLKSGDEIVVKCEGRFSLDEPAESWISEAQGISVEYERGFPIGRVVGCLVSSDGQQVTHRFSIGRKSTIKATGDVEVWIQLNDSSASRSNNSGHVTVSFLRQ